MNKFGLSHISYYVAIFLLILGVLFSFPSYITLGNSSNKTVDVNAKIQPSRDLEIQGKNSTDSRAKALASVDLDDAQKEGKNRSGLTGKFTLNLGSNTNWQLFARIVNLEETRDLLSRSGWELEKFSLTLNGKKTELDTANEIVASGNLGSHELEVSYEIFISNSDSSSDEYPSLTELENVIVFAVR